MLNLATNASSWTQLAMMPNPRNHLGSAVYNGKIYVFGGQKEHDGKLVPQDDVHMYDPATNTWTHVTDMPRAFNHIHGSVFATENIFSLLVDKLTTTQVLIKMYMPITQPLTLGFALQIFLREECPLSQELSMAKYMSQEGITQKLLM